MTECEFCGGLRINGAAVRPVDPDAPDGDWQTCPAGDPHGRRACRPCSRDVVAGDWPAVDQRGTA